MVNRYRRNRIKNLPTVIGYLLSQAEQLYESAGARNFLFIDIPPIDRAPARASTLQTCTSGPDIALHLLVKHLAKSSPVAYALGDHKRKYTTWNIELTAAITRFEVAHPLATVFTFSSYDTFTRLLDDPEAYGLGVPPVEDEEAVAIEQEQDTMIWVDHLHPTSAVHLVVARELETFLRAQMP